MKTTRQKQTSILNTNGQAKCKWRGRRYILLFSSLLTKIQQKLSAVKGLNIYTNTHTHTHTQKNEIDYLGFLFVHLKITLIKKDFCSYFRVLGLGKCVLLPL